MANLGVNKIVAQAQAAANAAAANANKQTQQFPQMVQPIENYFPTAATPAPAVTPVTTPVIQGTAQVQAPVQQPAQSVVMSGLGNWLLYQLDQERNAAMQAQQAAAQAQAAAQMQTPAPALPPADYSQQAAAIQQWLANNGQNPGLPVGTQPTEQLPIQILDLPAINNPMPGWSVPELQAQADVGLTSGSPAADVKAAQAVKAGRKGAEVGKDAATGKTAATDTSSTTPAGPPGEMFLMRPRGLSGPDGKREKAIQLTDYEGLADNARARRLSWGEYNKLTEDERVAADLNKLLVRSREDDLESGGKMKPAREAQYASDVAEVFGTEGTKSTTVAPRVVGLLADLDIDAAGKDLDDFLSLREGISSGDIDRGEVQMDLANRVQEKANTAFQESPDKYWNLNSAVRGLEPKGAKYAPPGFGKGKQPAQGKWNEEMLYENLWRGVTEGDPAWTVKRVKDLLGPTTFKFDDNDWDRLNEAMYLRAQNEKLYGGGQSKTMSSDDTKKRRSPDEVMQFLAEVRGK